MKNLAANPLDYVEGGAAQRAARRDLARARFDQSRTCSAFQKRGGKMIVTIGTNDTLASPGAQLDYYQAVLDKMGRRTVDRFARLFVMPQTGHGLSGTSYTVDGTGKTIPATPIPNRFDQPQLLFDWVEKNMAPSVVGRRQRRRPQPAALLVSVVSALCERTDRERPRHIDVRNNARDRSYHVSTRRHHHDDHTHRHATDRAHRGPVAGHRPELHVADGAERRARHRRGHGAHPRRQRAAAWRAAHGTVNGRHRA